MSQIKSHRDLVAWQKAFDLGIAVYGLTKDFPPDERFSLTQQVRRATVSIASNIAEGYGRSSLADYVRFLRVARGSLYEVDTQLLFALRLGYLDEVVHGDVQRLVDETGRVLAGLLRSLQNASA